MSKELQTNVVIISKEPSEFLGEVKLWAKKGWEVKCILPETDRIDEKVWCSVCFQRWHEQ